MTAWTGGCQCGAIRFRIEGELKGASICHCRMCQKAMGGFIGPFASPKDPAALTWTRGARKRFQSSNQVARGFCGDCGTPLTFEYGEDHVRLAIGPLHTLQIAPIASWQLRPGRNPYDPGSNRASRSGSSA